MKCWLLAGLLAGCASPQSSPAASETSAPEMSSHDDAATFQTKVNLVLVPVVVRDSTGRTISNLQQKDFALFDKTKAQVITRFSVEKTGEVPAAEASQPKDTADNPAGGQNALAGKTSPQRFLLYLFDDLHLEAGDLARVQKAASEHMQAALQPGTRAAIFTTSGRNNLDFTGDAGKLREAVMKIRMTQLYRASGAGDCPELSYYMADQITNKNDQPLLSAKGEEVILCQNLENLPGAQQVARTVVTNKAQQMVATGQQDTLVALSVLQDAIRRLQIMPGSRTIVLVSPGFVTPAIEDFETKAEIFDHAARANVTVNALDARGLYTTNPDASKQGISARVNALNQQYEEQSALAGEDVLAELAEGTGGVYFHNSNDLAEGFRRTAQAPDVRYLLGFSPQGMKPDGSFHRLKVSVTEGKGWSVQARRGYFAPKHSENEAESAKAQLEEAVFSKDELHDIPVDLHTQFFKPGPADARLTVLARIDLKRLHFKKLDGRNRNQLTVVSVLFDNNGNYVTGLTKTLDMRLRDETLAGMTRPITLTASFNVKPGSYMVRLVVRDAQGQMMSAENGAVDIP